MPSLQWKSLNEESRESEAEQLLPKSYQTNDIENSVTNTFVTHNSTEQPSTNNASSFFSQKVTLSTGMIISGFSVILIAFGLLTLSGHSIQNSSDFSLSANKMDPYEGSSLLYPCKTHCNNPCSTYETSTGTVCCEWMEAYNAKTCSITLATGDSCYCTANCLDYEALWREIQKKFHDFKDRQNQNHNDNNDANGINNQNSRISPGPQGFYQQQPYLGSSNYNYDKFQTSHYSNNKNYLPPIVVRDGNIGGSGNGNGNGNGNDIHYPSEPTSEDYAYIPSVPGGNGINVQNPRMTQYPNPRNGNTGSNNGIHYPSEPTSEDYAYIASSVAAVSGNERGNWKNSGSPPGIPYYKPITPNSGNVNGEGNSNNNQIHYPSEPTSEDYAYAPSPSTPQFPEHESPIWKNPENAPYYGRSAATYKNSDGQLYGSMQSPPNRVVSYDENPDQELGKDKSSSPISTNNIPGMPGDLPILTSSGPRYYAQYGSSGYENYDSSYNSRYEPNWKHYNNAWNGGFPPGGGFFGNQYDQVLQQQSQQQQEPSGQVYPRPPAPSKPPGVNPIGPVPYKLPAQSPVVTGLQQQEQQHGEASFFRS